MTERSTVYTTGEGAIDHVARDRGLMSHQPEHSDFYEDINEDTASFESAEAVGPRPTANDDSLFESYDRRSIRSIIDDQRAYRESQAAQAARTILQDAELPEFEQFEQQTVEYEDFENSSSHAPRVLRIRTQERSALGVLVSPGAQIVYVLLILGALGGILALAFSLDSPQMLLIGGVATPMLLPICVWRWFCWLDSSPYYYRLLTTLGEDARNLLQYRLLWKKST